jgi:V8-like Glu-specific endopeptidase
MGMLVGCGDSAPRLAESERRAPVVHGNDDRLDLFEYADQAWAAEVAEFTVALMRDDVITVSPEGVVSIEAPTLAATGVCPDERFAEQLAAAFCTGTLIGPDLVLTAGYCVPDASSCESTRFVFGYQMDGPDGLQEVAADDVFSCAELLVRKVDFDYTDYAIVRLDRPTDRASARLATGTEPLIDGAPLLVHGFPSGLPNKIDNGGTVSDGRDSRRDYFIASLDTFDGSNGAGVFDSATGELIGIGVTGDTDYIMDEVNACNRVNQCLAEDCDGQVIDYAFRAIESLCATGVVSPLCPCNDGVCDAEGGETTATCPSDCGTSCGDAVCNGSESAMDCPEDCGTCGDAVCGDDEDESTCCTDCGCEESMVCGRNACVPEPAAGDTCEDVAELRASGTYVVPGDTTAATDANLAACPDNSTAPDRVYSITLDEATWVDARVTGFDTIMYVRSDCADPITEILCNDDSGPPGQRGSRIAEWFEPGTHYLFVDGYGTASGPYELEISFTPMASNNTCDEPMDISTDGPQTITAMLRDSVEQNDYQGTCGGAGPDHVYSFTTTACADLTATVDGDIDSVLYLRSACASVEPTDELACNDDQEPGEVVSSLIEISDLEPGTYYLIVDAFSSTEAGEYTLTTEFEDCADEEEPPPEM